MKVVGIIPARYDSTRLPGKPLEDIGGISLIMRVYNQCLKVKSFCEIVVATDDERILNHVQSSGGKAVMTSREHGSGTERCAEALGKIEGHFDFVINVQGDEPFIDPSQIETLIGSLNEKTQVATLCMPIVDEADLDDASIPKVVRSLDDQAMYFSRSVIPHIRDVQGASRLSKYKFLKHIGIYAYSAEILATIVELPPSSIELAEQLEQLRWLSNGVRISAVEIPFENSISVDTINDLEKARKILG